MAITNEHANNKQDQLIDMLRSLEKTLESQRTRRIKARSYNELISALNCISAICRETQMTGLRDLTGHIATCLAEMKSAGIPLNQKVMSHLFIAKSLVFDTYEKYSSGESQHSNTRASAMIDSFYRCIHDMADKQYAKIPSRLIKLLARPFNSMLNH